MDIIEVKDLTKDYGFSRGVFDVSFSVKKGEVFGFLGPNGAGKSTTIRHLMGFSKPDSGTTKIFQKDTFSKYYEILKSVGYIPGEIALPNGLNGYEFIKMMQDMQGVHNDKLLGELLNLFQLSDVNLKMETKKMSLGVKRKLAIIVALMSDPDVLILDEPTSGLDPVMQQTFIDYILKEKERGKTILLSSHIFSEVDATCDRIAIIKDGRIVSNFIANDLKHAKNKTYNLIFQNGEDYEKFLKQAKKTKILNVVSTNEKELSVLITTHDDNINEVISLLSDFELKEFNNIKESLEEYFMKFYKEDKDFEGALK